jgi:hypothetical protein
MLFRNLRLLPLLTASTLSLSGQNRDVASVATSASRPAASPVEDLEPFWILEPEGHSLVGALVGPRTRDCVYVALVGFSSYTEDDPLLEGTAKVRLDFAYPSRIKAGDRSIEVRPKDGLTWAEVRGPSDVVLTAKR